MQNFCEKCGHILSQGEEKCSHCGTIIKNDNKNNKKGNKKIIWIVVCLILLSLFVILLFMDDNDSENNPNVNEKPILYKYDIETYDYSQIKDKQYTIEYSYTGGGIRNKASIYVWLYKAGDCYYYMTNENSYGMDGANSITCTYSINDNELTLNAKVKVISSKTEEDLNITGTFDKNYKTLTIGELNYHAAEYNYYLKNQMKYILIDPTTDKAYNVDGSRNVGEFPEQLDLTKYEIVKLIPKQGEGKMENISFNDFEELLKSNERNVVFIGWNSSEYCNKMENTLRDILSRYNITIYRLDYDKLKEDDLKKLDNFTGQRVEELPITYIIENGKSIHTIIGAHSNSEIMSIFEANMVTSNIES